MNRSDFLKTMGLGSVGLFLPASLAEKQQIRIYDNYLAGLAHYQYASVKKELKVGDGLMLKREATNLYDQFAVEVLWNDHKLGYLPAYENVVLANMLDLGAELHGFISKVDLNGDQYNAVAIEVYATLVLPAQKQINQAVEGRADDAADNYRQEGVYY
jgi:hypothetical protein